ncbi:MAG TPA: hypothetical protein VKB46_27540 [Pyrinomonadaceae bacterium]|nr:hypothetical protein [Pyrinomonadaceae bacterium]
MTPLLPIETHAPSVLDLPPNILGGLSSASAVPNLQARVTLLIESMNDVVLRLSASRVMNNLVFLLDYLSIISDDRPSGSEEVNEILSILDIVREEADSLVAYVEGHALKLHGSEGTLGETFDCTAYAIKHEVRRIFDVELAQVKFQQLDHDACAALFHARGVLTNCFQQCLITVARVFDNTLTGADLFEDWQARRDNSLLLYHDLGDLIEHVKVARRGSLENIAEQLTSFREGSMQYLMYKDWQQFERFSDVIISLIENGEDPEEQLHHLACYLETLFGHVKSRAVLAPVEVSE